MDSKEIIEVIHSGVSGIQIQGQDFARIDEKIEVVANQLHFKVIEWNWGYGWVDFKTKRALKPGHDVSLYEDLKLIADDNPANKIYIIQNAYSALKNDLRAVARLQQELLRIKRHFQRQAAIFLIAKEEITFPEILDLLVHFSCPPFSSDQVEQFFQSLLEKNSVSVSTEVKTSLISIFSGMERDMIDRIFKTLKNRYGASFQKKAVYDALYMKKRALSQSGLLEIVDTSVNIDQIGGLGKLKSWLRNKKHIIDNLPEIQKLGISVPKGILLAGMPGCGKSMSAKAAASLFKVPLLRLDIGSLMGKFVGESEANIKNALKIAEQASPCVLWIDELEKAFSGINGTGGSTEITTRLFGYFLTWMQEKPGAVFVIATANDITTIPPELLRRGRFDEIFYINLPNKYERKQIFTVKSKQLPISYSIKLNFEKLAAISDGFSGADIECVINNALEELYRNSQSTLSQDVLKKHLDLITPISVVLKEKIESYQELFKKYNLKPASLSEDDIKHINSAIDSSDLSERENAAANEFISPENLIRLVNDSNSSVRHAALKNPQCPIEVLKDIVDAYESFDFRKPGYWSERQFTEEDFDLALHHPNMSGGTILNLYTARVIDDKKLLSLAHKLNLEERKKAFDTAKVKLSRSITSGVVQNIRCRPEDIVNHNNILIELDDEKGRTLRITASVNGLVSKIYVKKGETINAGEKVVQLLVPKNQGSAE